jgi:predicted small lipoprotein YifL
MRPLIAAAALALVSCGPKGPLDQLTGEERDAFERGTTSHVTIQQALTLSDQLFDFDPTLDAARTANENAGLIQAKVTSSLNGCGTVALNNAAVTVNFGQAPGCTLPNGMQVSGVISIGVSKQASTLSVTVTFNNLTLDGSDLTGSAAFSTTNATTFTVVVNLSSGSNTMNANVTVVGSPGTITLDGTATATRTASTTTLTFTSVAWSQGECYPHQGSVLVKKGRTEQTYTFSASTPTTGNVELATGRQTVQVPLPAYGNCPPP